MSKICPECEESVLDLTPGLLPTCPKCGWTGWDKTPHPIQPNPKTGSIMSKFVIRESGFQPGTTVLCLTNDAGEVTHAVCNLHVTEAVGEATLPEVTIVPFDDDGDVYLSGHKVIPWAEQPEDGGILKTTEELALEAFTRVSVGPEAYWPSSPEVFASDVRRFSWQAMALHAYNAFMGDDAWFTDLSDEDLARWLRTPGGLHRGMADDAEATNASFHGMADGGPS
jgi:hypothetical protein